MKDNLYQQMFNEQEEREFRHFLNGFGIEYVLDTSTPDFVASMLYLVASFCFCLELEEEMDDAMKSQILLLFLEEEIYEKT